MVATDHLPRAALKLNLTDVKTYLHDVATDHLPRAAYYYSRYLDIYSK